MDLSATIHLLGEALGEVLRAQESVSLFETEEHAQLRDSVRRFSQKHIAPHAHAWEEACEFPRELYKSAAEANLLGISYQADEGGAGGDVTHAVVAAEEMLARWEAAEAARKRA